ncbi:MAG: methylmalonyl-CoA mutase family protein [Chthoniobacter sp.]|nr:methylmalonyl-CoA mutase family protein [Chthoniobacter sp.]
MMSTEELLKEFPPVSTAEWEQVIQKDLKGADYAKKLIWQSPEGLAVKPYYRADDLAALTALDAAPGAFPYLRGTRAEGGWFITEEVGEADPEKANAQARAAIAAGAGQIAFTAVAVRNLSDLALLLAGLDEVPVHFTSADEALLTLLAEWLATHPRTAILSSGWNPLENPAFAAQLLSSLPANCVPFTINAAVFEESGATAVEETGFALSAGIDALAALGEHGIAADRAAAALTFSFSIGADFFFSIAKLRAFRLVWAQAVESFGGSKDAARARIAARTSRWNQAVYDAHNNILRGTEEALAAILGGADSIAVAPYDECFRTPSAASRRLARNTQLVLKLESHLGSVTDPGGGSYYLETLTDFIARDAWKLMQKIESQGGYRKVSAAGTLAALLAQSLGARNKLVAQRRSVLTGVNQFVNAQEKLLDSIDPARIDSIRRAAQPFEQLRLRTERHAKATGNTPRILFAEIGDIKMRGARSQFASDFFACAGFTLIKQRFDQPEAIAAVDADAIVLCSSDPEYPGLAAALLTALQHAERTTPVIVAGNPDTAEELKAAGVADFVHIRTNPLEFLTRWQQQFGIEA